MINSPIPFAIPDIGIDEIAAVSAAMQSGWLTTGPNAAAFEDEFADALGGDCIALAVNSATAGLHLALEALGVGPGDEVIVPTWTFTATAEVVRYVGADPVIVDVDRATLNLDLASAEAAVTTRTKAVVPVHFAGLSVDVSAVQSFAAKHGLLVVEDAAHSMPATSAGVLVGAAPTDACVFSFYATKPMTTGEGGMVVVRNPDVAHRIRTMRLHGINRDVFDRYRNANVKWQYEVVAPGFKYNLTDPAAAMGRVQLRRSSQMHDRRAAIGNQYDQAFRELPLELPAHAPRGDIHSWHLYVIRLREDAPIHRDAFICRMAEAGIGCSVHFIPLHLHPYWRDRYALTSDRYPVASAEFQRVVSLPIFSRMTSEQVLRVVDEVTRLVG